MIACLWFSKSEFTKLLALSVQTVLQSINNTLINNKIHNIYVLRSSW